MVASFGHVTSAQQSRLLTLEDVTFAANSGLKRIDGRTLMVLFYRPLA